MKYLRYLLYILKHKWYVGKVCFTDGLWIHAITHDLSKFSPREFFAYADKFYGKPTANAREEKRRELRFQKAWNHHQNRNKHHWNYWVAVNGSKQEPVPMPMRYIYQMIADWHGMADQRGAKRWLFYNTARNQMILHQLTRIKVEQIKREEMRYATL